MILRPPALEVYHFQEMGIIVNEIKKSLKIDASSLLRLVYVCCDSQAINGQPVDPGLYPKEEVAQHLKSRCLETIADLTPFLHLKQLTNNFLPNKSE